MEFRTPNDQYVLAPGETVTVSLVLANSPSPVAQFVLHFSPSDVAANQLVLSNWTVGSQWTPQDETLLSPSDTIVTATSGGVESPSLLGTFDLRAPDSEGSFALSLGSLGGGSATRFGQVPVLDFGDVQFVVREQTSPTPELLYPIAGSVAANVGYIDVRWQDLGDHSSGVRSNTIDPSDITIFASDRLVTIDRVVDRGNGVWRYIYNDDLEVLNDGRVFLRFEESQVEDLQGNGNVESLEFFDIGDPLPQVINVELNSAPIDPLDLPSGVQPTSWKQQHSELNDVRLFFNKPVDLLAADFGCNKSWNPCGQRRRYGRSSRSTAIDSRW